MCVNMCVFQCASDLFDDDEVRVCVGEGAAQGEGCE